MSEQNPICDNTKSPQEKSSDAKSSATTGSNCETQSDETIISNQKIQKYVKGKQELYKSLLMFLENPENQEQDFQVLIDIINNEQEEDNREKIKLFLCLLAKIADNYHRNDYFFKNIFHLITYFQEQIKQTFSNTEIFNIFETNKIILLFLFENKIITIDDNIIVLLTSKSEPNGWRYCHFFYPEIKGIEEPAYKQEIENIEKELLSKDTNIFDSFPAKRHEGQNDSYICSLIREDSVEEFISYTARANIPLNSKIKSSLFETNSFLIQQEPSLIEYSAFFGSIQIFQYLRMNDAELTPSLWLYAIHSRNAELIHLLETLKVEPPNNNYTECFIEAVKCHHNEIAEYIENNLMKTNKRDSKNWKIVVANVIQYHNYAYFPSNFVFKFEFFALYKNGFYTLANLYMKTNLASMEKSINPTMNRKMLFKKKADKNQVDVIYYLLLRQQQISDDCFKENKKLEQIAIPSSITSIDKNAFYECYNLRQIIIPSSVTSIGNNAFDECVLLEHITIPSSVKSIGSNAFCGCQSLKQIIIPSSITSLSDHIFANCRSLEQITIPSSVTSIGKNAFYGCSSLKQAIILSSITKLNDDIFSNCLSLSCFTIPSSVKSIENNAFYMCSSLKQIIIPSSATSIGNNAFENCQSLNQVTIPSSVKSFGKYVFAGIESIEICGSIDHIPDGLFERNTSLKHVAIHSSVTSIGNYAFYLCSSLSQITLPSSVTSIGDYAFYLCSSLSQITLPQSLTSIGGSAFSECRSLEQIEIPSSVTSIGNYAFEKCSSLIKVTIPSSIAKMGSKVFSNCTSLPPNSVPSSSL